jgi:hypothetical protein
VTRAERQLGVILKRMAANGERAKPGNANQMSRGATSLDNLGIPRDRASRAMQLADVPADEFEAALALFLNGLVWGKPLHYVMVALV